MTTEDKFFLSFMSVWLLTQLIGCAIFAIFYNHQWPETAVNAGFILILGIVAGYQEFRYYRNKL